MSAGARRSVADLRRAYGLAGLAETDLAADPMTQFDRWLADAVAVGEALAEPNAMVLSTVGPGGRPSSRMVLLKGYDDNGFVFYTNYRSRKGSEIEGNPAVSLQFPWYALERQVVVTGDAERTSREQTQAYFRTRPRPSQVGAHASPQSEVVSGRDELDRLYAEAEARFPGDSEVPAPEHWGGYLVRPLTVEFWQGRPGRMHDRLRFRRDSVDSTGWVVERLAP